MKSRLNLWNAYNHSVQSLSLSISSLETYGDRVGVCGLDSSVSG